MLVAFDDGDRSIVDVALPLLRARNVPVAYLEFAGEGHGFRRAETMRRALDAELYFHARVLGIHPAESLEPVVIEPPLP